MADETTATETVEPQAPAQPEVEATETPKPEPTQEPPSNRETDWRAAYVGLQTSQNKVYRTVDSLKAQNTALAEAVKVLKEGQSAILKQTLGEDEAAAFDARQRAAAQQQAAMDAARAADLLITSQLEILVGALNAAGIDSRDPEIDWAADTSDVQEWKRRVLPSIQARIQKENESRIRKATETFQAKSAKEVKEEAEALAQRQLKAAGVDKIDTAKGSGTTSLAQKIADMDPASPEFQRLVEQAKSGRLKL